MRLCRLLCCGETCSRSASGSSRLFGQGSRSAHLSSFRGHGTGKDRFDLASPVFFSRTDRQDTYDAIARDHSALLVHA
jgi:hypothetical protein